MTTSLSPTRVRRIAHISLPALLLGLLVITPARAANPFGSDKLWSDGKAEFSLYSGRLVSPGGTNVPIEGKLIVVKEDFDRKLLVKSDADPNPRVNFTVLKQNLVVEVPSGTYVTHLMTSSFIDVNSWKLVKLTASSTEACGITLVMVKPGLKLWTHHSHSYFDEEGDRDLRLPAAASTQALDALPLWLRGKDLNHSADLAFDLLPDQAHGRVRNVAFVPALAHIAEAESVTVPAGTFLARRVEVRYADKVDVMEFETAFPFRLLRMESHTGMVLELRKSLRLDYWNKNHPGDEKLLDDEPAAAKPAAPAPPPAAVAPPASVPSTVAPPAAVPSTVAPPAAADSAAAAPDSTGAPKTR